VAIGVQAADDRHRDGELARLRELGLELRRADGDVRVEVVGVAHHDAVALARDGRVPVLAGRAARGQDLEVAAGVAYGDEALLRAVLELGAVGRRPLDDERARLALRDAALRLRLRVERRRVDGGARSAGAARADQDERREEGRGGASERHRPRS
jgi:hypothetical protein